MKVEELGLELMVFIGGRGESPGTRFETTDFLKQLTLSREEGKVKQPWKREG